MNLNYREEEGDYSRLTLFSVCIVFTNSNVIIVVISDLKY